MPDGVSAQPGSVQLWPSTENRGYHWKGGHIINADNRIGYYEPQSGMDHIWPCGHFNKKMVDNFKYPTSWNLPS